MLVLGIDIETGASFDKPHEENFITEIGAVLFDTKTATPVKMLSKIVYDENKISSPEAIDYTGITNEMRKEYGVSIESALQELFPLIQEADYIMAHNGENFDKPIILQEIAREFPEVVIDKVWIDSQIDYEYHPNVKSMALTYLKGKEGIMYPGHRAVFDVMAMLEFTLKVRSIEDVKGEVNQKKYLDLMEDITVHNLNEMITSATSPMVTVRAVVTFHQLKEREEAKKNKFRWNPETKLWTKQLRKSKLENVDWGFKWEILNV